jgi:hypothetical protein
MLRLAKENLLDVLIQKCVLTLLLKKLRERNKPNKVCFIALKGIGFMVTDKNTQPTAVLDRILRERLDQFDVPLEVRTSLRQEIMTFFARPERKPSGATVMTPSASMAADKQRQGHDVDPDSAKPQVL